MSSTDQLRELIQSASETQLRAVCADAIREWHKRATRSYFDLFADFSPAVTDMLARRTGARLGRSLDEAFIGSLRYDFMAPILEFLWWMVRTGLAIPFADDHQNLPQHYHLTRAGLRWLAATDAHPLQPGFIQRIKDRCPGLPDDVTALLADAHACYEHGLHRPAVMLLGVAYESAVEEVADALLAANHLTPPIPSRAAARLATVKASVARRFPGNTGAGIEARTAAEQACDFADHLRRRRNDGSHPIPRFGFDDHSEIEELLVSSSRYLPDLWSLR